MGPTFGGAIAGGISLATGAASAVSPVPPPVAGIGILTTAHNGFGSAVKGASWGLKTVAEAGVLTLVDFRTNTGDGKPYGVVTSYCEGLTRCPNWGVCCTVW